MLDAASSSSLNLGWLLNLPSCLSVTMSVCTFVHLMPNHKSKELSLCLQIGRQHGSATALHNKAKTLCIVPRWVYLGSIATVYLGLLPLFSLHVTHILYSGNQNFFLI